MKNIWSKKENNWRDKRKITIKKNIREREKQKFERFEMNRQNEKKIVTMKDMKDYICGEKE